MSEENVKPTIAILYNPISGRGEGTERASEVAAFLKQRGYSVELKQTVRNWACSEMQSFLAKFQLVIVAGGDGTLMNLLPGFAGVSAAVYMLPLGTESLFAREFNMTLNKEDLLRRIEGGKVTPHCLASVNNQLFFHMVSLGVDSEVIEKMSQSRVSSITRGTYILPTLRTLLKHHPPKITLKVDGRQVLHNAPGFLIVGNTSQYALKINFLPEADSTRKELVARFISYRYTTSYLARAFECWLGGPSKMLETTKFVGQKFEVSVEQGREFPVQSDGDFACHAPAVISMTNQVLHILDQP